MLPAKRQKAAIEKSAFGRALARFRTEREALRCKPAGIGFLIDATGSRTHTWREALQIQEQMFRSVSGMSALSLRLVHFGGVTLTDHGWMSSPHEVAAIMREVSCVGGSTQILPGLRAFLEDGEQPSAIILIGDCFEESASEATALALELKEAGIRVFSFHEGDEDFAATVFRELAETTGGKFARFGMELPLRDLCEGVTLLTAGGDRAVKRLSNPKVRRLLLTGPAQK